MVLDPLPTINKAYSMVLRVEMNCNEGIENNAMLTRTTQTTHGKGHNNKKNQKKEDRFYDHCKANSHTKDACFRFMGILNGIKQLKKDRVAASNKNHINMMGSPLEEDSHEGKKEGSYSKWSHSLTVLVQHKCREF